MPESAGYRRQLTGSEKYFVAYNELRPPYIVQFVIEADGEPEPDAVYDALQATTVVNPGSSIKLDDRHGEHWVRGPEPNLSVVEDLDINLSTSGAPLFSWPLNAVDGPTCELVLVQRGGKSCLVFRALHAVMDGHGVISWAKDFFRCLRGEAPLGHPGCENLDSVQAEKGGPFRALPPSNALHPFGKAKPNTSGCYEWRRVSVDRPLEPGLIGRLAVRLAKQARSIGPGIVRMNIPVDLRPQIGFQRSTANLFSAIFVEVPEGASAASVGMKVVQSLYRGEAKLRLGHRFADGYAGSLALHRVKVLWDLTQMHQTSRYLASATLSHLGKLRSADLSGPGFTACSAFFVPMVGDSGCVLTMSGFEDRTEATAGLVDRFTGDGQLDVLTELLREAITEC